MILSATQKELGPGRFRAVIRMDQTEHHLAGLWPSAREAQNQADSTLQAIEHIVRKALKLRTMTQIAVRGGRAK